MVSQFCINFFFFSKMLMTFRYSKFHTIVIVIKEGMEILEHISFRWDICIWISHLYPNIFYIKICIFKYVYLNIYINIYIYIYWISVLNWDNTSNDAIFSQIVSALAVLLVVVVVLLLVYLLFPQLRVLHLVFVKNK